MAVLGAQFLLEKAGSREFFIPEQFTQDELELAATARRFMERDVFPNVTAMENKDFAETKRLLKKAGELGLLMTGVPEEHGGLGLPARVSGLISEVVSIYAGFSVSHGAHTKIGTQPLVYFGNEAQKERWLPKLASGELIAAYALSEAGSGSDAQSARTVARLSDDKTHYIVTGSKQWITNGAIADLFTVFCQIEDGSGAPQFSALLIERDTPGFEIGREEHKLGIRGSSTTPLVFTEAKVPVENLLGNVGDGARIAFNILNVGRYNLAIGAVGGVKEGLKSAVAYATERKQFNTSTMRFGAMRQKAAEIAATIYGMEALSYRVAGMVDDMAAEMATQQAGKALSGAEKMRSIEEYAIEASIGKVWCSEVLNVCASELLQMYGGYGYVEDYPAERMFRDARINMIFEGTNEVNRLLIPGQLLKRAMKGRIGVMPWIGRLGDGPAPAPEGELSAERAATERIKGLSGILLQTAAMRYMQALEKEQQVLLLLADLIIDAFVADSAVGRAMQRRAAGLPTELSDAMTRVLVSHAADRAVANARRCARAVASGPALDALLTRLSAWAPDLRSNVVADRDLIANAVSERGGYPL